MDGFIWNTNNRFRALDAWVEYHDEEESRECEAAVRGRKHECSSWRLRNLGYACIESGIFSPQLDESYVVRRY